MKNTLITGANRGLGQGFTRHYLERGDRVFACARDGGNSEDAAELAGRFGDRSPPVTPALSD